ncbi:MAG: diguanylate cyclase [Treponema sp.]|nr:diguanylate cyclase [Treponema sp.]
MKSRKMSFKNKVLFPAIIIFIISILLITANDFRLFDMAVRSKTNSILDIYTNNILMQINHLDIILETTRETLNKQNMATTRSVALILDQDGVDMSTEALRRLCEPLGIIELTVADANGTIIHSNFDEYIGFNYGSAEPTKKYMELADGTLNELLEEPRKSELNAPNIGDLSLYTGISRKNGGFLQIGYDVEVLQKLQDKINIAITINETKPGETGYGMVIQDGIIIAHPDNNFIGHNISSYKWYNTFSEGNGFTWIDINEEKFYAGYKNTDNRTVIGLIPEAEYNKELKQVFYSTVVFLSIALLIMIFTIYKILNKQLKPITKVTEGIREIANGNFSTRIEGSYSDEFAIIKNAVNDMAEIIEYRDKMLKSVNHAVSLLLNTNIESFDSVLFKAMGIIAESAKADRMYIFKNHVINSELHCSQLYEWSKKIEPHQCRDINVNISYTDIPLEWGVTMINRKCVNILMRNMPRETQAQLFFRGILSILLTPIYINDEFWGFMGFDDCQKERVFTKEEEAILCSSGLLFANAVIRNDMQKEAEKIYYDALTGIYNRRYFDENMNKIMKSLSRSGSDLSLMMIDIDFFKNYNDTYGHNEGDVCLKEVAKALSNNITREYDFVARYGGEEFAVVLPYTDKDGALLMADKILESIIIRRIAHKKSDTADYVTVSIGVTTGDVRYTQNSEDYIKRADEALYMSKQDGRNRQTFLRMI